jgi:inhibitor of cysteine peptidase
VPLRFLMENTGYQVRWIPGPTAGIDIRPIVENPIIIGTTRQRRETSTLGIEMQYPWISGLDAAVQDKMNAFFASRTVPSLEQAYQSERDSIAAAEYRWPTELCLNYAVTYNQQNLLSILFDDYIYTGGAHGSTLRTGYTVDIKTGTTYALKDLFAPGTDYVSLLSAEIDREIKTWEFGTLEPFSKIRDNQDFYIKDGNLVIYFQQYELMPYAAGFPEFSIPMALPKTERMAYLKSVLEVLDANELPWAVHCERVEGWGPVVLERELDIGSLVLAPDNSYIHQNGYYIDQLHWT